VSAGATAGQEHPGPAAVLDFWFGLPGQPLAQRAEWFRKDAAFDDTIRQRFGPLVDEALAHGLPWGDTPPDRLAQVIVLDQFPRNLFRGDARAFAGDARALALALGLIDDGSHLALHPMQRWFAYLPLEHAEDLTLQDRCVALCAALAAESPDFAGALDYARRHRDVIARYGRFPHRNAALGRASTPDEVDYLATPGSGF
jgi:uncharacterized protein (DUF924 family)